MWDLVPWPGVKPRPPALGTWSLSHWTTREAPWMQVLSLFNDFWNDSCASSELKVTQSCLTLCKPKNCTVHGILRARILEWVAFPFFRGWIWPRDQTQVSRIAGGFFTSWATTNNQFWGHLELKTLNSLNCQ